MSTMNKIDQLQDTMDGQLQRGLHIEAAQDALELVQILREAANADPATLEGVIGKLSLREVLGSENRQMRKDMASG